MSGLPSYYKHPVVGTDFGIQAVAQGPDGSYEHEDLQRWQEEYDAEQKRGLTGLYGFCAPDHLVIDPPRPLSGYKVHIGGTGRPEVAEVDGVLVLYTPKWESCGPFIHDYGAPIITQVSESVWGRDPDTPKYAHNRRVIPSVWADILDYSGGTFGPTTHIFSTDGRGAVRDVDRPSAKPKPEDFLTFFGARAYFNSFEESGHWYRVLQKIGHRRYRTLLLKEPTTVPLPF